MQYINTNSLGMVLLFSATSASAQNAIEEAPSRTLEETIITASQHGKTEEEIAGSLNLINGAELDREMASTLGETLQNQIGVQSSSFGPGVGVPVIRGQSGKRVEILQNNSVVADVSDTSADHAVATEAFLADRIEILRGPATLRYGAARLAGWSTLSTVAYTATMKKAQAAEFMRDTTLTMPKPWPLGNSI